MNKCFRYFSAVGCVGCPEGSNNSHLSLMSNESLGPIGLLGIVLYHCSELEVVQYECYSNEDLRDWLLLLWCNIRIEIQVLQALKSLCGCHGCLGRVEAAASDINVDISAPIVPNISFFFHDSKVDRPAYRKKCKLGFL